MPIESDPGIREAKRQLRTSLLIARAARSAADRQAAAIAFCTRALALAEVADASTIACYVSMAAEPGTSPLLDALTRKGVQVLLPVLQGDFDLDWAPHQPGRLVPARFGLSEPAGPSLGPEAIREANVVFAPALAVDLSGNRLGRGGGSYDRALARLSPSSVRATLVYDGEVLADVPIDEHDQPVQVVITPRRTLRVRSSGDA